jgi:hypothetical protein
MLWLQSWSTSICVFYRTYLHVFTLSPDTVQISTVADTVKCVRGPEIQLRNLRPFRLPPRCRWALHSCKVTRRTLTAAWSLNMEPVCCSETSVTSYQLTPRNVRRANASTIKTAFTWQRVLVLSFHLHKQIRLLYPNAYDHTQRHISC